MISMAKKDSSILPDIIINIKDINYGMVLVSVYILIEIGTFRVFDIVHQLQMPFLISLLTLVHAIYLIINGKVKIAGSLNSIFILFCIYVIIYSQLDTINPFSREMYLKLFLQYLANYIIIVGCVKKPQQFVFMIDVFLFAVLHSSYHSIHQGGRIYSALWLRGENNVGLVCAYAIPFAFFLYINYRDSIKKYFYLLCMFASVTGVIVANSRGGFVATAAVGFFCWFFIAKKARVLMLILVAAILVVQLAPERFFVELKTLEQGTEEGTADERIYSWGLAVQMFADHPILGVGPFNYPDYFLEYDSKAEGRFTTNATGRRAYTQRVAHSTQFQWLAEFGIVGVILFFYFQLKLYRNWRVMYEFKIPNEKAKLKDTVLLKTMTHANLITQIGFWVAALFISIIHYPFYWFLPAFSEVWKNIYMNYVNDNDESSGLDKPADLTKNHIYKLK